VFDDNMPQIAVKSAAVLSNNSIEYKIGSCIMQKSNHEIIRSVSSAAVQSSSVIDASCVSHLSSIPLPSLASRSISDNAMSAANRSQYLAHCEPLTVRTIRITGYHYDADSGRSHSFARELSFSQKDFLVLAEREQLGIKITSGGSGASVFSLSGEQSQPVLRKIMPNHGRDSKMPQEKTQDAEAKAGAILLGFENSKIHGHNTVLGQILLEKKQIITDFVRETRPAILSRFILTERPQPLSEEGYSKVIRVGVGYDQSLVTDSEGKPAKPFSSVIENENQPLSEHQLDILVQTQLRLTEKLYIAQEQIYLSDPLSVEEGTDEFQKSYWSRLSSRVLEPLEEGQFEAVSLNLGQDNSQNNFQDSALNLQSLLRQPEIIINGQSYLNPLHLLLAHQDLQKVSRLGFLLHGDLQQSNAIYIKESESESESEARLICIDNRPPDIKDALFDLIKILWGPAFLPVLDDRMDLNCMGDAGWRYHPQADFLEGKKTFERFNDCFTLKLLQSEVMKPVLEKNGDWQSHVDYCTALQFMCDLGFIIPELKNAQANGDAARVTRLSKRIIANFIEAAQITAHWSRYTQRP